MSPAERQRSELADEAEGGVDDETVEVPAGTFEHAIHFQKAGKNYWYLRGVGKLKETGSQTEEDETMSTQRCSSTPQAD